MAATSGLPNAVQTAPPWKEDRGHLKASFLLQNQSGLGRRLQPGWARCARKMGLQKSEAADSPDAVTRSFLNGL